MRKALLISCFDWYKSRLQPIREILIGKGYSVTVLEADFDHIKKAPLTNRYPECTYVYVPRYKNNVSVSRIISHLKFGSTVAKRIKQWKPDLIYLQIPPNNTARYCRKYKARHSEIKLILDIIDLWPESMPLGRVKNTPISWVWKKWRNDAIAVADHVFTECGSYQSKFRDVLDKSKISTLYLFKEQTQEERALVKEIMGRKEMGEQDKLGKRDKANSHAVKFAYLGSMNHIIDIDGICNVIRKFQDSGYLCELYAIGDGESKKRFERMVQDVGCITHFYGLVFDEMEKIKILAPCDYAFNMMKGYISVGLTIKSIDYLSYGLPLINNIKGDTARIIKNGRIGINVDKDIPSTDLIKRLDSDKYNMGCRAFHIYNRLFSKMNFVETSGNIMEDV